MIRRLLCAAVMLALLQAAAFAQDPTVLATLSSTSCPGSGCVALTNLSNRAMASVEVSGTWTGTLLVEITGSWTAVPVFAASTRAQASSITANGTYLVPMGGASSLRVRASALSAGSAVVRITAGQGSASFELPTGIATAANQATGNSSLSSIDGKLTASTSAPGVSSSGLAVRPLPLVRTNSGTITGSGDIGAVTAPVATFGANYVYFTVQTTNFVGSVRCWSSDGSVTVPNQMLQVGSNVGGLDQFRVDTATFSGANQTLSFSCAVPAMHTSAWVSASNYTSGSANIATASSTTPPLPMAFIYPSGVGLSGTAPGMLVGGYNTQSTVFSSLKIRGGPMGSGQQFDEGIVVHVASGNTLVVTSSALPTGAATESTLSTLNGKIPASPATDRATAAAPFSARLSDGSSFYKATTPTDTQPVSAASLPLPTGAATSAKQPALGTAGTAASDVVTVQGIASMTPLLVNGSGATQPVSGTVTANAGTGTFAISAAALPLPAGAATSSKQPALGTAGSAAADVVTVQGVASMTPLLVNGSGVTQPVSGTVTANAGTGTFATSSAQLPAALAANGGMKVEGVAGGVAVPVSGTFWQATQPVSGTVTANAGTGTMAVSAAALPLPSGASTSALQTSGNALLASLDSNTSAIVNAYAENGGALPQNLIVVGGKSITDPLNTTAITLIDQPPGGSEMGLITRNIPSGTQPVSGTFWPATQPVSAPVASPVFVRLSDGASAISTLPVSLAGANDVDVLTFPDNEPFNVAQINGVAPSMGNGASGTGVQRVTIANDSTGQVALAAGTNAIGKLTANSGVIIGDVNAVSIVPGTGATNLGKTEDAAHTTGDVGVMAMGVRKDTNSQTTNADGDYTPSSFDAYGTQFTRVDHPNRIRCTVTVSTATTLTAVGGSCAAPGAGLSIYITDIEFSASASGIAADAFPTLKYGTGGTCGTGTTVFWGALSAAAIRAEKSFATPIKIPANSEVCWITSTAGSKFLVLTGFVAP